MDLFKKFPSDLDIVHIKSNSTGRKNILMKYDLKNKVSYKTNITINNLVPSFLNLQWFERDLNDDNNDVILLVQKNFKKWLLKQKNNDAYGEEKKINYVNFGEEDDDGEPMIKQNVFGVIIFNNQDKKQLKVEFIMVKKRLIIEDKKYKGYRFGTFLLDLMRKKNKTIKSIRLESTKSSFDFYKKYGFVFDDKRIGEDDRWMVFNKKKVVKKPVKKPVKKLKVVKKPVKKLKVVNEPVKSSVDIESLPKLKVVGLKQICRDNKIKGFSKLRKKELIELIINHFS